ncbi:hypothetical protein S7711_03090 [Stachybotrys chartarum IBT 7711]|uniref:Hypervirulence associated protein TUDOR domain-containing protein n=1 Tax=Stachybotrys chartarum (strain CBS 109288 / IBT 7711) TaxID=1280523 RepID=A0A084B8A4_STACB|nr:hypothetical protein S7711_03090 [Stachybotrys chartarum IBT 7711]
MKPENEVIDDFNELVNMTAKEIEAWLKSGDSRSAGWPKDDGSGESVGHDSGRKIVEILNANPDKDPEKYTEDQIQHMRKVVSYCKRHLAQEEKSNNEKSDEEVKETKSYASLKNWGHDPLKKRHSGDAGAGEDGADENGNEEMAEEQQTGGKRKAANAQNGASKKRETRKGQAAADDKDEEEAEDEKEVEDEEDEGDEDLEEEKENKPVTRNGKRNGQQKKPKQSKEADEDAEEEEEENDDKEEEGQDQNGSGSGKQAQNGPNKGDTVSWNWGGGQPEGKVLDVKPEKTTIKTKRGNEVSRNGDPEDPAVVLDTGKSKAIKSSHELN